MDKQYFIQAETILNSLGDILSQKENVIVEKLLCTGADSEELHRQARIRRRQLVGDRVFVRGSLEYSNVCTNNCSFCGMAKSNQNFIDCHLMK